MNELIINNHLITTPLIDILKQIKKEISNGKLKEIIVKGDEIKVTCPVHKDGMENKPSCGIYCGDDSSKYGKYNCFTCGACGSFSQFVAECFDRDEEFAKEWLVERFSNAFIEQELHLSSINLFQKKEKIYLDESILDTFQSWHPYMEKRHLGANVCKEFKVKYDPKTECVVFPVWDEKDKLYMLTKRSVNTKRFYIPSDVEKPVYLLNYIRKNNIKEITLVESQINCLTLWSWGIPSVATFGCNITDKQISLLNKSGINHLYICYDGDKAGIHGTLKTINSINKNIFVDVIVMDEGKDVNDITEDRFNQLPILNGKEWIKKYAK